MITQAQAIELFNYDPVEGTLVMRSGAVGWFEDGYIRFHTPYGKVRAHQIAWLITHNEWVMVDHKDGDRGNNKLANLRVATKSQNAANTKLNSRNTTGLKGISFCSATQKWRASIRVNGKSINLGRFLLASEAHDAYAAAAIKHFGEFARAA